MCGKSSAYSLQLSAYYKSSNYYLIEKFISQGLSRSEAVPQEPIVSSIASASRVGHLLKNGNNHNRDWLFPVGVLADTLALIRYAAEDLMYKVKSLPDLCRVSYESQGQAGSQNDDLFMWSWSYI